jgi:hypothetical protein
VPVTVIMSVTMRAPFSRFARLDEAVLDADLGAHRLQALDVLVDRARADRAAARQRHLRLAEARQQRPQHEDRRAHGLDQLVRRDQVVDARRVEPHAAAVRFALHAHLVQDLQRGAHVLQVRHVVELDGLGAQQARTQNRQRRVLRARHDDLAGQPAAAFDHQLVHPVSLRFPVGGRVCRGDALDGVALVGGDLHSVVPVMRSAIRRASASSSERVDFLLHAIAERRIDELVPLDRRLPSKAATRSSRRNAGRRLRLPDGCRRDRRRCIA